MLNRPADVKRFSNELKLAIVAAPNRLPFCGMKGCATMGVANASVCKQFGGLNESQMRRFYARHTHILCNIIKSIADLAKADAQCFSSTKLEPFVLMK